MTRSNLLNNRAHTLVDWKNPDYSEVYDERLKSAANLTPDVLPGLFEYYKTRPVEFINDWGLTFDPRNVERDLPATVPFILFPHQADFIRWCYDRWRAGEDGLAEKSRDMGVSWLCVAFAVWLWLFHPGTVIGFGSRKEEYVDKLGDPKSLFWKARQFINLLPEKFRPDGYVESKHAPHMRIVNPVNGSAIVGEAGDNIGRGNRASIYFKDESAFYDRADAIDAALSQTSNCKIDVSTPNGAGNAFYRKRMSGKIPIFTFHWTQDPRKDEAWYKKQCETLDPVIVAQEIDIDYNASSSDAWIGGALVEAAMSIKVSEVVPIGGWKIGIDAAHMGDDETVIHFRRGRLNLPQHIMRQADGPMIAQYVEGRCKEFEFNRDPIAGIVIELDGPGVSVYDQLKLGKYHDKVVGVHTGARQADSLNFNLRAKLWRRAKEYLEDAPVSMSDDRILKAQLSSLRYRYKDGLLIMQDKKEYKKEFNCSPDRADAFILSHGDDAPVTKRERQISQEHVMTADCDYDPFDY